MSAPPPKYELTYSSPTQEQAVINGQSTPSGVSTLLEGTALISVSYTFTPQIYNIYQQDGLTYAIDPDNTTISNIDPSVVLQTIANRIKTRGSGIIHISSGNYIPPQPYSVTLYSNTTVEGEGKLNTIMTSIGFTTRDQNVALMDLGFTGIFSYGSTGGSCVFVYNNAKNIALVRLDAKHTRGSGTATFYIYLNDGCVMDGLKLIDLTTDDTDGYGILINGVTANLAIVRNVTILRCKTNGAGLAPTRKDEWVTGIDFCEMPMIENMWIEDCVADNSWESGFHGEVRPTKTNVNIINCSASNNGRKPNALYGYGFLLSKGITIVHPQGTGNLHELVYNDLGQAVVIP